MRRFGSLGLSLDAAPTEASSAAAVVAVEASQEPVPAPTPTASPPHEQKQRVSLSDFELGRVLGRGSFGTVALATKLSTGETYAIKSLSKRMLIAVLNAHPGPDPGPDPGTDHPGIYIYSLVYIH